MPIVFCFMRAWLGVSRLAICCRIPKSPNHKPLIMRIKD